MKKLISLVIMFTFFSMIVSFSSFAERRLPPPPKMSPLMKEVRMYEITAKKNAEQIEKLKKSFQSSYNKAKIKIKNIQSNTKTYTPERAEKLREILTLIDEDSTAMTDSSTAMDEALEVFLSQEQEKLEDRRDKLINIIALQNTHIDNLKKIIFDINQINKV